MALTKQKLEPKEVLDKAADLAEQGYSWLAPRAEKAWQEAVRVASPHVEAALEKAHEGFEKAHDQMEVAHAKLVEDVLPRVEAAAKGAQEAAKTEGTVAEKASAVSAATKKGLMKAPKKKHTVAKVFGFLTLAAVLAGAGYLLWRRAQPVEDPWAEEYWEDIEAEIVPAEEDEK